MSKSIHQPPLQHIHGKLLADPRRNGRHALLLLNPNPDEKGADSLYLRYAFLRLGNEKPVFPGSILDDWGAEIRGIKMYRWVRENGDAFPRAEIFGMDINGSKEQYFVRELDLTLRIRCYVYTERDAPLAAGKPIQNVMLLNENARAVIKRRRPAGIKRPIRGVRATYWEVPPLNGSFDFSQLDLEE